MKGPRMRTRALVLVAATLACRDPGDSAGDRRAPFVATVDGVPIPKIWDERELAAWATPVAGLGVPPGHYGEAEYYAAPVDDLRTYPVYLPSREPPGYRDRLRALGPRRLIEPEKLKTKSEWIEAGRRVFDELDTA